MVVTRRETMDSKLTIKQLFNDDEIHFRIPTYQRAYSWDEKQVVHFLDDIKEQNPYKKYFFGNFLFERESNIEELEKSKIDGNSQVAEIVVLDKNDALPFLVKNYELNSER